MTQDQLLGKRVFQYEILSLLGKGGMGAVYRARHTILNEIRAVKVLKSEYTADPELKQRFIDEARSLTRLNHPNLSRLFEFFQDDEDRLYMVTEYLEGETLHARIKRVGAFTEEEAIRIGIEVCRGLAVAHRSLIIHRDISPDNIMLLPSDPGEFRVKLIDFGIAKRLFEGQTLTSTGLFVGKFYYCSPEQAGSLGPGETLDHRSDLYSLGVVLYQMVSGELPFRSTTPHAYLLDQVKGKPRPLRTAPGGSGVSEPFEAIVQSCLEMDRTRRPGSAEELILRLISLQPEDAATQILPTPPPLPGRAALVLPRLDEETPTVIEPVTPPPGTGAPGSGPAGDAPGKRGVTRRLGLFVAALLLIVLAGGGALYTLHEMEATPPWLTRPEPAAPAPPVAPPQQKAGVTVTAEPAEPLERMPVQMESTLTVRTDPPGAVVFLHGERVEQETPVTIRDLEAGRLHELRVEKDGFTAAAVEVTLESGEERAVEVKLERVPPPPVGVLYVQSDPVGATVYLGGKRQKEPTPCMIRDVSLHEALTLKLERAGFEPWTHEVRIDESRTKSVSATLTPARGSVLVSSEPADADVYLNGVVLKHRTPRRIRDLPLDQTHEIRLVKTGYEPWTDSITLRATGERTIHAVLTPLYGSLLLNTVPWTEVHLDGVQQGGTPVRLDEVRVGLHRVRLSRPDLGIDESFSVEIEEGRQVRRLFQFKGFLHVPGTAPVAVYVDDRFVGNVPVANMELLAGTYRLRLSNLRDRREKVFTVLIEHGKTTEVEVDF